MWSYIEVHQFSLDLNALSELPGSSSDDARTNALENLVRGDWNEMISVSHPAGGRLKYSIEN